MKVFKFGGASIRNAAAIRQVGLIVGKFSDEKLLIVVSAMGKTTNALERMVQLVAEGKDPAPELDSLFSYHAGIMDELFNSGSPVFELVEAQFGKLRTALNTKGEFDMVYDQVVSMGEVIATTILAEFLKQDHAVEWIDARKYIATDSNFRAGKVDWAETAKRVSKLRDILANKIILTQGFIGGDPSGLTTTLGREGSDYSAAVFASCLKAESVTIWKDVPGVMNADPKRLPGARVFEELPFKEAAEMTYYGASIIHPKTIKPLANNSIPLYVKNFDDPSLPGTRIHECTIDQIPPLIVFLDNQCLISCKVIDYTFVNEEQLSFIFRSLADMDVHINLMQNSAISFSICVDFREQKVLKLIQQLSTMFEVYYNTGLTLITVKNYDQATYAEYRAKKGIILEQSSRSTLQLLLRIQ